MTLSAIAEPVDPSGAGGEADAALARAIGGDAPSFELVYRDTHYRLVRFARTLVGGDAEDVVSESWLQIARDIDGFSGDLLHFRAWAATIVRHRALDHLRASARRPATPVEPADDALAAAAGVIDPVEQALENLSTRMALDLIAELPRDQAEAVLLRVVLGLDAARAGTVLGKRPGAVRVATHRGLQTLAARLGQVRDV